MSSPLLIVLYFMFQLNISDAFNFTGREKIKLSCKITIKKTTLLQISIKIFIWNQELRAFNISDICNFTMEINASELQNNN